MKKGWFDKLPNEVYVRLCECRNNKKDIQILVDKRWEWMSEKIAEGIIDDSFTKEDALVYILDLLDANSQWMLLDSITVDEYNALKA